MDQTLAILGMTLAAGVGILATLGILRRERTATTGPRESPFAASTEGEKRCPKCGMGNLWTASRCSACGSALRG